MAQTSNRAIICEGFEDAALVQELARVRGLPEFQLLTLGNFASPGKDALAQNLIRISVTSGFKVNARHIWLISDADDDCDKSFRAIVGHIKSANNAEDVANFYHVPAVPFEVGKGNSSFKVVLLPGKAKNGSLENILWSALQRLYPKEAACVEELINCSGIEAEGSKWNLAKRHKARVHAAIGVINRHNPSVSISKLWEREPDLIPATEPEFNEIYEALLDP